MGQKPNPRTLSDDELRRRLSEFVRHSRHVEANLVAHIAEFDARRLYAREASSSMFAWCTEVLHLSEHQASLRIAAARASREHPVLLAMLRDGRLHLTAICKLAPHLTPGNRAGLLQRAEHRSKRQIEELVASLAPRPAAPAVMRRLPDRRAGTPSASTSEPDTGQLGASSPESESRGAGSRIVDPVLATAHPAPGAAGPLDVPSAESGLGPDRVPARSIPLQDRPAVVEPIATARFRVRFDASTELRDKLERLQALMHSTVPDGDLGKIIDQAVTEKLERLEARRYAKTKKPRKTLAGTDTTPKSRHIPAAVRRVVEKRDGGRCAFRDPRGRRCSRRHDLEFHHRRPFGKGGHHTPENLALMCRAHNGLLAEQDYGAGVMGRYREGGSRMSRRMGGSLSP